MNKRIKCRIGFIFCTVLLVSGLPTASADNPMCVRLFDYQSTDQKADPLWRIVNDNVMGGRSDGSYAVNHEALSFSGFINTDGGGFSSIRHSVPSLPFFAIDHLRLSVRSDGRPYTLSLADDFSRSRGVSHRAAINTSKSDTFQEIKISAASLVPMFRGRAVQAPSLDTNKIREISIMLNDSVDGEFQLDIAWIDICRA